MIISTIVQSASLEVKQFLQAKLMKGLHSKQTVKEYPVKKVVICKEAGMKDMWCLVCSLADMSTQTILTLYGKRWSTETSYRDEKDLQFGFGLKKSRI